MREAFLEQLYCRPIMVLTIVGQDMASRLLGYAGKSTGGTKRLVVPGPKGWGGNWITITLYMGGLSDSFVPGLAEAVSGPAAMLSKMRLSIVERES